MRLLLKSLALLPRSLLQFLGVVIGSLNDVVNSRAAKVTSVNLELCGQEPGLRHESLRETGKTMMETPAVWLAPFTRVDSWIVDVIGEEILVDAINSDDGLLVLLPHIGNWELFNVFYRRYGKMTALYHPPDDPNLELIMAEVRSRHGNEMVPTNRQGITRLFRVLGEGGTVVVLPDQVPASGEYAPFFGVDALTDELSVRLLKRSGARAVVLAIIRRPDGRFDVHIKKADDTLAAGTSIETLSALNQMMQWAVQLAPAQYQWEYKRFRERPAGEKKVYRFNKPPGVH